ARPDSSIAFFEHPFVTNGVLQTLKGMRPGLECSTYLLDRVPRLSGELAAILIKTEKAFANREGRLAPWARVDFWVQLMRKIIPVTGSGASHMIAMRHGRNFCQRSGKTWQGSVLLNASHCC